MGTADVGAVVAGGGIAGLAAGLELQQTLQEVLVVDASDRPGGVMRTDHVSGYVIERGPNTVQVKAPMRAFVERERVEDQLLAADPSSKLRFIYRDGELLRTPGSPLSLLRTPLLSGRGKLRLLAEPFIRRGQGDGETVSEFVGRRLGSEVVSGLVGPFLTGVYAGDEDRLGAGSVFPSLVAAERRASSIALGLAAGALGRRDRGLRGSYSAVNGLGPFARALAERLVDPPALNTTITGLRRDGDAWLVFLSGPAGETRLRAQRVVIATPAPDAADILRGLDGELSDLLAGIEYAPIVGVPVGVAADEVSHPIEGFGFLVPRDAGLNLLGCLFMSQLFPSRAPEGRELLQCLLGGVRWPEAVELPDDVVVERLFADLDRALGLRGEPRALAVTRWRRAIPQPAADHGARIRAIRERVAQLPGLSLAGSYLAGVSVSDSLASGLNAAADSD